MKKAIFLSLAAFSLAAANLSAQTNITIAGSTAFRSAANAAILASFNGTPTTAWTGTGTLDAASQAYFSGTITGIAGTTTIRTNWNGSVGGIDFVKNSKAIGVITSGSGSGATLGSTAVPTFAFSDVQAAATPYGEGTLEKTEVGVIVFVPVATEGADAGLVNVTAQQLRTMNSLGAMPLTMFTNDYTGDAGKYVVLSGRNDASGTRTAALAESGYGYTNIVQQFRADDINTGTDNIGTLKLWPLGTGSDRSLVWTTVDTVGNGGYNSGGTFTTVMGRKTVGTNVVDQDNGAYYENPVQVMALGILGTTDAISAIGAGAKLLGYNGVTLDPVALASTTPAIRQAEVDKVASGAYTLWSFQNFYHRPTATLTTEEGTFKTKLLDLLPAEIVNSKAGLTVGPTGEMKGTARATDGGSVTPNQFP